jgi:hypothetical protein
MVTVDSDKVVCGGIHAMTVAALVWYVIRVLYPFSFITKFIEPV